MSQMDDLATKSQGVPVWLATKAAAAVIGVKLRWRDKVKQGLRHSVLMRGLGKHYLMIDRLAVAVYWRRISCNAAATANLQCKYVRGLL